MAAIDRARVTVWGKGAVIGVGGMAVFFAAHHVIVLPIWLEGLPRGLVVAVLGGALLADTFVRVRDRMAVRPPLRGIVYGALVTILFVPSLPVGLLRVAGAPPGVYLPLWALLFLLVVGVYARVFRGTQGRIDVPAFMRTFGSAVAVNGFPAVFLFFLDRFVVERAPGNPWPMAAVLAMIYVAGGWTAGRWLGAGAAGVTGVPTRETPGKTGL